MKIRETTDKPYATIGSEMFDIPVYCACCKKCWYNKKYNKCMCGGPFDGYSDKDKNPLTF